MGAKLNVEVYSQCFVVPKYGLKHEDAVLFQNFLSIKLLILYTGCNRRNGPDFGRVFLRSYYTDITQNTYIQSSMVTEILAREV